jgi:flagellar basal-body rod modification protein FlgD
MSTAAITNTSSIQNALEGISWREPKQTLGQDEFLKLLVTQMTAQDPLNPQKDTDFIAQMAQFSALEQTKAMQAELTQLRSAQQLLQADSLLGQKVTVQSGKNTTAEGLVTAVKIEAGTPTITVDGKSYNLDQVITVQSAPVLAA